MENLKFSEPQYDDKIYFFPFHPKRVQHREFFFLYSMDIQKGNENVFEEFMCAA